MPRPTLPPTPVSSTDIKGQDEAPSFSSIHLAFELPPPAIHDPSRVSPADIKASRTAYKTPTLAAASSPRSAYPLQAAETVKSRRRMSVTKENHSKDTLTFALPPPPTRSRKIIQMKPQTQQLGEATDSMLAEHTSQAGGKRSVAAGKVATIGKIAPQPNAADASGTPEKRKHPSSTSAAGRKIARKTAHSLIERRRRSKMNEEFAVLKNMIPACSGEMHKLAILQVCDTVPVCKVPRADPNCRLQSNMWCTWKIVSQNSRRSKVTIAKATWHTSILCRPSETSTRLFKPIPRATWKCQTLTPSLLFSLDRQITHQPLPVTSLLQRHRIFFSPAPRTNATTASARQPGPRQLLDLKGTAHTHRAALLALP